MLGHGGGGEFNGTFDGLGHVISGMYVNQNTDRAGFFAMVGKDSLVKNLGIVNSYIKGSQFVGGIIGR